MEYLYSETRSIALFGDLLSSCIRTRTLRPALRTPSNYWWQRTMHLSNASPRYTYCINRINTHTAFLLRLVESTIFCTSIYCIILMPDGRMSLKTVFLLQNWITNIVSFSLVQYPPEHIRTLCKEHVPVWDRTLSTLTMRPKILYFNYRSSRMRSQNVRTKGGNLNNRTKWEEWTLVKAGP